ncbi:40S ribosomal protein S11-like, partial [Vombatus ursinus]
SPCYLCVSEGLRCLWVSLLSLCLWVPRTLWVSAPSLRRVSGAEPAALCVSPGPAAEPPGVPLPLQTERAYQKQPTIFQNKKRVLLGDTAKEKLPRYYKNIGLGFKTPKEAIEGTYIDKKCPFTGNVSIRGRILSGVVTKMKMQRTIVIRRDYLHYIRKYNRFEKRHKNMSVHLSPCFR